MMRTGQRVSLLVGLIVVLAGIGVGLKPVGDANGTLHGLYCATAGVDVGSCPSRLLAADDTHAVSRSCGSAFLPTDPSSGAADPAATTVGAGTTQQWARVPDCGGRVAAWRYPAIALVAAGLVIALAGSALFRSRGAPVTNP